MGGPPNTLRSRNGSSGHQIYERLTLTRLERNENASALAGRLEPHFTALEKLSEAHKKSVLTTALDSSVDHGKFYGAYDPIH
jgi:hypothetical protein